MNKVIEELKGMIKEENDDDLSTVRSAAYIRFMKIVDDGENKIFKDMEREANRIYDVLIKGGEYEEEELEDAITAAIEELYADTKKIDMPFKWKDI